MEQAFTQLKVRILFDDNETEADIVMDVVYEVDSDEN